MFNHTIQKYKGAYLLNHFVCIGNITVMIYGRVHILLGHII